MRYLIALAFCFALASPQVHACVGPDSVYMLFFEAIPNPQPDADVIAEVSLSDVDMRTLTVTVIQVLKTSDARVHQGDKIAMKYRFTSCGPNLKNGDKGTIIARIGTDSQGHPVLYPYMRRRGGGSILEPRSISE